MFVVDCSVAAAWALADESGRWTQMARTSVEREGMVVPRLFWFEIRNILIVNERRGRIDLADGERFIRELPKWTAEIDEEPDGSAVMTLARLHRLTVYDAVYLELASRRKLALCTLDEQLIAAAPKAGVRPWQP